MKIHIMTNVRLWFEELADLARGVFSEMHTDRLGQPYDPDGTSVPHIRNAIGIAAAKLLQMQGVGWNVLFPEELYKQLIPAVMLKLKMQPITNPDGTVINGFYMPEDIPEPESFDFNRVTWDILEQALRSLEDELKELHTRRYLLLVELFAVREPDATSPLLANLELIDRAIVDLRERITIFCYEYELTNPLIPPPDTSRDKPTFAEAVNYNQRKHDFLEMFQPSPPEEILLADLPDFLEREWHLFHFTFSSDTPSSDNIREDIDMVGDRVFDEDIRLLHHRLIERKMLIAYSILIQMIDKTRGSDFGVEQNILYLPFQALCDDIHRLRVAHLEATIWDDEDEKLPPSWIEGQLWEEYAEIENIPWVLESYQTRLSPLASLRAFVDNVLKFVETFVHNYRHILLDDTLSGQQKYEKILILKARHRSDLEVCLDYLSKEEDQRADELQDDPLFDNIARTINSLSVYLDTDGHISE